MNRLRAIRDQLAAPALAPVDGATAAATVPTTNDHDHDDVDLEARTLAHREQQARAHLSELSALLVEQASNIKDAHAAAEWVKALVELHACSGDATVAVNEQSPLYVDFVRILLSFFPLETVLSLLHHLLFDTAASPIVTKETILTLSVFYNHCTRNHLALPSASILNVVLPTLFEKESGSLPAIPFDAHLGVFAACIRYLQSCITAETDPSSSRSRPPASLGLGTSAAAYTLQRKRHELWSALLKTIRILWKAQAPQGSARLTAYINIVFPILRSDPKLYMDEAYRLYVELIVVELSSIRRNAQGQALMNGMKTVKNGMVAILRHSNTLPVTMVMALKLLDTLQSKLGARIDVLQLQQLLQSRGMDVKAAKAAAEAAAAKEAAVAAAQQQKASGTAATGTVITMEQQAAAIISALHYYAHPLDRESSIPAFDAKQLPLTLVTEIVLRALHTFGAAGSVGAVDGGLSAWQSAVTSVKVNTANILSRLSMGDEEEKRKETEAAAALKAAAEAEKAAKEKRIMPFALQPDANQLVKLAANQDADERKRTTELVLELVGGMVRRIATRTGVVAAVREADDTGAMEDEDGDGAMVRTREQRDEEDGGYDEAADGDALMRLEGGSVRWLYALSTGEASVSSLSNSAAAATGTKRKRITNGDGMEEDSTAVVVTTATTAASLATIREMFKGSRGFWTTFIARFIAHAGQLDPSLDYAAFTFYIKSRVLVAFILEDFPGRWDFAVRWLWEEMYHAARSGNDYAEYDYWLCVLLDQLFRTAEHGSTSAQLQASTYIPWFVHQNESALFRKFILALPRLPTAFWESAVVAPPVPVDNISIESVASPGYLLSLLETPVNKPLPTPLQKLRIQLGMELLYDFIIVRPSTRKLAIAMLLGYCIHADRARRSEAIRVARRFWTKSDEAAVAAAEGAESSAAAMVETSGALAKRIADRLEGFAMKSLRELSASPKVEAGVSLTPAASTDMIVDGAPGDNDDDIETTTSTEQPAPQPDWTEDQVARQLDLFMVMAVRDPLLLRHLFALYPTLVSDVVKRTILSMLGRTIAQIGMPRADNPTSLKLVEALDLGVDEGSELLLLRVLQMLHASLKTKGGEEDGVATRMSVEVTAYVRRQLVEHPSRYSNPLFWAYILTGEGLATEDIVRGVVMLLSVIDEDPLGYLTALADEGADASTAKDRGQQLFVSTISRLLTIQQADARSSKRGDTRGLSPVDLLVLLHSVETSPPFPDLPAITTRQMVTAITLCLQNPALSTHFTYSMYANALERLLDRHMADLPKIVMSTLRHVARKYRELHGFTVDVLTKIANTRIFKGRGRMEGYGKAMWEYWVRCMEIVAPKSFQLLVQLSRSQVVDVIELVGTPFKEAFYTWLHTRHRTEKVAIAMEILEKMRADAHQREVEREDRREDHRDSMDMRA